MPPYALCHVIWNDKQQKDEAVPRKEEGPTTSGLGDAGCV